MIYQQYVCNRALRAYWKKVKFIESLAHKSWKNWSILIIKRSQKYIHTHTHTYVFKYISDWSEWFLPEPTMNLTSHSTGYIFAHRSLGASLWPPELFDATHECTRATYTIAVRERIRRMHIICSRIIKNTSVLFSQATAHRPADERGGRYLWKQSERVVATFVVMPSPLTVNRTLVCE